MHLDDDEFTREPLLPEKSASHTVELWASVWGRVLPRWLVRRILFTAGICALLAVTILVATGNAGYLWQQARFAWLEHTAPTLTRTTITPPPFGQRTLGQWEQQPEVSLPSPDIHWYVPAPNDPRTLYACSAGQSDAQGRLADGPLRFWYSHDAGRHWSSVRLPQPKSASCYVTVAGDAPQRIAVFSQYMGHLLLWQDVGCTQAAAFLSMDGGAHWQKASTLPDVPIATIDPSQGVYCGVNLDPTARHLYLFYHFTTWSGTPGIGASIPHTALWRSDDAGTTWRRLNEHLPPGGDGAYPLLLNDGETLLLSIDHYEPPKGTPTHLETMLWVSHDDGDSWNPWGTTQGLGVGQLPPPWDARSLTPSPAHPLYLLSGTSIPSTLLRIQIAQVTNPRHWAPLPPLPIAGASPQHLGITSVLTETASGKLLVLGLGPHDRISGSADDNQPPLIQKPARQWLWEWDPQASQWTILSPALDIPWPDRCSDQCWQGQLAPTHRAGEPGAYIWVTGFFPDKQLETRTLRTFRIWLPNPV